MAPRPLSSSGHRPRRPPGVLALADDSVLVYPFDETNLICSVKADRLRKRRRAPPIDHHHHHVEDGQKSMESAVTSTSESSHPATKPTTSPKTETMLEFIGSCELVLLLVLDESQPHSIRLRNQVLDMLLMHNNLGSENVGEDGCRVLVVTPKASTDNFDPTIIRHTGWGLITYSPALQAILGVTHVPSLVVLNGKGRKVSRKSHEECALEWNKGEQNLEAWREGRSALTAAQQVQVATLYCTIL